MRLRNFYVFLLALFIFYQPAVTVSASNGYPPMTCDEKLKILEPSEPKTIYDYEILPDRDISKYNEEVLPISLVQKKGSNIPFVTVYKNLDWQRPAYNSLQHSSNWRWSNIPINMAYQQHKIFDYVGGGSWWYDLSSYLALPSEAGGPSPINKYAFTTKYPHVVRLIIFNFDIKSIKYYNNQYVVSGEPLRKGLTIVDFDTVNLPKNKKLLQLATPDGYELDYLIQNY